MHGQSGGLELPQLYLEISSFQPQVFEGYFLLDIGFLVDSFFSFSTWNVAASSLLASKVYNDKSHNLVCDNLLLACCFQDSLSLAFESLI